VEICLLSEYFVGESKGNKRIKCTYFWSGRTGLSVIDNPTEISTEPDKQTFFKLLQGANICINFDHLQLAATRASSGIGSPHRSRVMGAISGTTAALYTK
jgi:hypothetical protein